MKFLFLLFFLLPHTLFAHNPRELAEMARLRAPQILMSLHDLKARSLGVSQSTIWQNPSLSMQSGRARTGRDFGFVMDLTLMQSVPWPGTKSVMKDGAKFLEELSELDAKEASLRIYHATLLLGLELGHFEKLSESKNIRKRRLNEVRQFLEAKTFASVNDKIEKDMILNQLLLIENDIFEIDSKINLLRSKLKRLAGVDVGKIDISFSTLKIAAKEEMLKELELSPQQKRQEKQVAIAKNEVKKAQLATHPDVQVGLNYRIEHLHPENEFVHANLAVSLPLWDRGQYREEMARAEVLREEARGKFTEMNLVNSFDELYSQLEISFNQTKKFPFSNLKKIQERSIEVDTAFRKGRIEVGSLLQADTLTYETIKLTYQAHFDYYKSLADLHDLLGKQMDF